ncbi:Pre-mRNA polyadenylation factor Fip [Parasponia andersonii]|uniref:Pre-mRNA polyadenylation factor Fip n=1 Tax=Parasponia andersonii TaxID=3476 RepID=A0A2P5E1M8_PARAD|nr:Pre-mRNA polyadenylation factor Fip [Parasponia andersonii]
MEDDDEFGDLYTDVLRPFASSSSSSSAPQLHQTSTAPPIPQSLRRPIDLNLHNDDDGAMPRAPSSNPATTAETLAPDPTPDAGAAAAGSAANNSITPGEVVARPRVLLSGDVKLRDGVVKESNSNSNLSYGVGSGNDGVRGQDQNLMNKDVTFDIEEGNLGIEDVGSEPVIPGLESSVPIRGSTGEVESVEASRGDRSMGGDEVDEDDDDGSGGGGGAGDDWDSDSEDDLQIVLNDSSHGPLAMERGGMAGGDDDDDEDEDGLVIVADGDPNQAMEEQDWGEDSAQVADGERKEIGEAGKAGAGNVVPPKIGYSNHGYHPFHSQFKYVRPGAAPMPGATTSAPGVPGQVRPLVNVGPVPGRGRGDWRPMGLKNATPMQKNFHSGFGVPAWGSNTAGRGFGGGLEFTLPSHKTIFDVDVDSFEEKPWKYPGVDTSDFFNFGFNEDSWKDYCKQLEQFRLESTMQSKIRVYESGRAEQEYDPDLPPELAAAAGIHDVPSDNANPGKSEVGQGDITKGSARVRPPLPTGRAIQVEGGYGERLPSIDTRPARIRDADAIIEDSLDDDASAGDGVPSRPDNNTPKEDFGGGVAEEDTAPMEPEYIDSFPHTYEDRKRELVEQRMPFPNSGCDDIPDRGGVLTFPPESPVHIAGSSAPTQEYPDGDSSAGYEERQIQGRARDRSPHMAVGGSARDKNYLNNEPEESVESMDSKHSRLSSSPATVRDDAHESSFEHRDGDDQDELVLADGSSGMEKDETTTNIKAASDTLEDGATKKQKISSRVEQPFVQEPDDGEDSKAARSSDNSRARSGSSRDYQKRHDGIEEEVVQGHSTRVGSVKSHFDEKEQGVHRRNRDGRPELERNRMVVKGREEAYPYREFDPSPVHLHMRGDGFDRRKERDNPDVAWQRRDDDSYRGRIRTEETRKRERGDEMASRLRSKVRESDRNDKDELIHSRKQMDNGSHRVYYEKDVGPRHRERDGNVKGRYEHMDDYHGKRKKVEEHLRKDHVDKEELLHGHRENTNRRKRERDDVLDQRKRDGQQRLRDNLDDHHSVRHKDEAWLQRERGERQREREEWQRLKQSHEENIPKRERDEGRSVPRGGRGSEDKGWVGHSKVKDDSKGSDKDYQYKETVWHSEPSKRRERTEDESPYHGGREDTYARGNQISNGDRRSRQERPSIRNDRSINASDDLKVHDKKHKENARRNKESDGGDNNSLASSRRSQEEHGSQSNETGLMPLASRVLSLKSSTTIMNLIFQCDISIAHTNIAAGNVTLPSHRHAMIGMAVDECSSGHGIVYSLCGRGLVKKMIPGLKASTEQGFGEHNIPLQHNSSRKQKEDASDDDEQQDSRRGRSKLERWTSHKERDFSIKSKSSSTLKLKETDKNNIGSLKGVRLSDEPSKPAETVDIQHSLAEEKEATDPEVKDADTKPLDDRHLDTVERLKKRSERFKLPMPSEKDALTIKKMENEVPTSVKTGTQGDSEIKQERPARKRRWISS